MWVIPSVQLLICHPPSVVLAPRFFLFSTLCIAWQNCWRKHKGWVASCVTWNHPSASSLFLRQTLPLWLYLPGSVCILILAFSRGSVFWVFLTHCQVIWCHIILRRQWRSSVTAWIVLIVSASGGCTTVAIFNRSVAAVSPCAWPWFLIFRTIPAGWMTEQTRKEKRVRQAGQSYRKLAVFFLCCGDFAAIMKLWLGVTLTWLRCYTALASLRGELRQRPAVFN